MDLLEYQGKQLFARHGLKVSSGEAVTSVADAQRAADAVGYPVVVKAQVLIGGRGKAGGVKLAADAAELREHAGNILGMDIGGHTVRTLWIEHASDIAAEYYASVMLDRSAKKPLVMFSVEGGVDIEQVAERTPEKLIRAHVDPLEGLGREQALEIARAGGVDADVVEGVADALVALYEVWVREDATLAEINPLIVTPEREVRALDSKVSLDGNALYRHPENQSLSDAENEDPIERRAKQEGVQYVKLDGDIGILGNGAGLVMSTLDVVARAGGSPANFLDAGGGSDAEKIKQAVQLILANDAVKAVLFNIFGGITRGDEVAKGLVAAFDDLDERAKSIPFVVRLDGTNDVEGRRLLQDAALANVHTAATMNEAAEKVVELAAAAGVPGLMAVLVDERTRLAVAGITGREGSFHTLNNRAYGTNVVGGVTPGKGGQDVEGIPVFDSWAEAMSASSPNTAMIFVPPRFAADSILEAAAAGVELVVAITEGIPAHDELRVYNTLLRDHPRTRLIGPNCPGVLSPGKANVGIIPAAFFNPGNVGVVSRSGTLTYQIGNEIAQAGFGCSSIVGIGGDPVPGSSFVDVLALFEVDEQTELVVLSGEIGGSAEEEAAEFIAEHMSKPVVAYIAGFTAPAGKQMGHAGAIVSGSAGTAAAKAEALEAHGVRVGRTPTEAAEIAVEVLGGASAPAA